MPLSRLQCARRSARHAEDAAGIQGHDGRQRAEELNKDQPCAASSRRAESGEILGQGGSWPHQADYVWRRLVTPVSLDAAAP